MDETLQMYRRQCQIAVDNFWHWSDMHEQTSPLRIWKRQRLLRQAQVALFDYQCNLQGITSHLAREAGLSSE